MSNQLFNISNLNGRIGFSINGVTLGDRSGFSVSSAGDINGDGNHDLIIGAPGADPNGLFSGTSYVVFGGPDVGTTGTIELADLDGTNGFVIAGLNSTGFLGFSVSSGGDINGDGTNDLLVSAPGAGANNNGVSYVVFGGSTVGSTGSVDLSSGFAINGIDPAEFSGHSISNLGDVNGDGKNDLLIGAPHALLPISSPGLNPGNAYVVFGGTGTGGSLDLSTLDGTNGFLLTSSVAGNLAGFSVSSAGDINGDGIKDFAIGVPGSDSPLTDNSSAGKTYVVFGGSGVGATGTLDLSSIPSSDPKTGFVINGIDEGSSLDLGDRAGWSVSDAGDVNGDGVSDLIIGAPFVDSDTQTDVGEAYVVFGGTDVAGTGNLDLASLDGTNGFAITGIEANGLLGSSVSYAGDLNKDGFADVAIGAKGAGKVYVLFGSEELGTTGSVDLSTLNGEDGLVIEGTDSLGFSVSGAKDVNSDSIDDLVIGAPGLELSTANGDTPGNSYVLFGNVAPVIDLNGVSPVIDPDPDTTTDTDPDTTPDPDPDTTTDTDPDTTTDTDPDTTTDTDPDTTPDPDPDTTPDPDPDTTTDTDPDTTTDTDPDTTPDPDPDTTPDPDPDTTTDTDPDTTTDTDPDTTTDTDSDTTTDTDSDTTTDTDPDTTTDTDPDTTTDTDSDTTTDTDPDTTTDTDPDTTTDTDPDTTPDPDPDTTPDPDPDTTTDPAPEPIIAAAPAIPAAPDPDTDGIDATVTFTGNQLALFPDNKLTLSDANNTTLVGATVKIANLLNPTEELLTVDNTDTLIAVNFDANNGILSLSGVDTIQNYQQVLNTLEYENTSGVTDASGRIIQFVVDDGLAFNNVSEVATLITIQDNDSTVIGTFQNDTLLGGNGNDTLEGNSGNDLLDGGAGNDSLVGGDNSDTLLGGDGNDVLDGGTNGDFLDGGAGNDNLSGGENSDTLIGAEGNDSLFGGNGDDILEGGLGNDILSGAGGIDTYVLNPGEGTDTVFSFEDGIDMFKLGGDLTFDQLAIADMGATTITANGEVLAQVFGVSASQLTAADFIVEEDIVV
ncbi:MULTISPECIES: hypothetical protein [unclassified Moorena]|nr:MULTISPECIES: hypothetical protein [unclassified Moorena]NEP66844.1 hypothetical protein [Moorena sp. SIO3A5]NER89881.1 hypothetical protein [Moorena sp. SIO3A2]